MGSVNCKSFKSTSTANEKNDIKADQKTATMEKQPSFEYVEGIICNETDIQENEMKQFELGDVGKVLLVKKNGKLSALGNKCTHYGALLSNGVLSDGRIRCQWHGACFNILTGDIEDFPGLDSLPCYQVTVEEGQVKVRAKRIELETNKRTKIMAKRNEKDYRTYVIVGGGPSGATCAETLRQEGFAGRIVMICKEPVLPYDRIKLSKALDLNIESIYLRSAEFYEENSIEMMLDVEATSLDTKKCTVTLSNGYVIKYDKIYIATGSKSRKPKIPGVDLANVVTLRNHADAVYINSLIKDTMHVVVLGVSFIGLEAAAFCANKVAKVTVIGRGNFPLEPVFGKDIGARIMSMFKEKGVEFKMSNGIKRCIDDNGTLTSVELNDGEILRADLCIMGTGSTLYTKFLENSGVEVNKDGSIDTDMFLESNVTNVFVGGDIANAPVYSIGYDRATIGHYPLAQYHGRIAALNMVDKRTQLKAVPYFWTVLFGKSFRYSGYGTPVEIIFEGSLEELKFVAFHIDIEGKVIGVSSCMWDPIVSKFAEFQNRGKTLYKSELEEDPFAWAA